jgi:hypothetical protein
MTSHVRLPFIGSEVLTGGGVPNVRAPLVVAEALTNGLGDLRLPLILAEGLTSGNPIIHLSLSVAEPLTGGNPNVRCSMIVLEALFPVPPEGPVSTELFPTLPGLTWNVHKKPTFSTRISPAVTGQEVRNAFYQFPKWFYELTYDYIPDLPVSVGDTALHTLMGFFLSRQGSFDTFLFLDPDDNATTDSQVIGLGDDVTLQFFMARSFGGFSEPVGQINLDNPVIVEQTDAEPHNVPASAAFTITVTNAATFLLDLGVTLAGTPLTKVSGAPATGQYAEVAGVYTFNAAQHGAAVIITYHYTSDPAGYTITLPNLIIFDVAPIVGSIITASFSYYFVCRFTDDSQDYEKFSDKLWQLGECNFQSVPT